MSRHNVECSTCGAHVGYVYHSAPIGWMDCVECGDAEQERKERKEREDDDERCPECGTLGCQGHCAGDDMMGDS